ncbi:MAG TPA: tRNA uridine-5-carboxymethylaminomethyl(34) synthesis GTPase MnmE [Caulobacteraceae bacterium]|nr:tRNA uridine-5-carboxymethylaminomethyl(34) synthesis GTPase MnmE [Caulobacteraceae bacterium]
MRDTIFALATAPGRAAIAVVRLSGPGAGEAVRALAGRDLPPRAASLCRLNDPGSGAPIDEALVLWFPAPASFTGEDQAELQLHGGPAVVEAAADALAGLGLRLAEPGEFTRRAFENGRLDLSQAEAIADLVEAETGAQRRQALDQLGGALARRYETWRDALIDALAWLEAEIDFPDEDLPEALVQRAGEPLRRLAIELAGAIEDTRGERVREGLRVALVGAPNAGKSSLINALLGRDAAIVTAMPGTTRDVIEAPLTLDGYRVLLADMAGVREAGDPIEAEGVRRARAWAESAALRLWVVDGSAETGAWREASDLIGPDDLLVLTKADRGEGADAAGARASGLAAIQVSTVEPGGIDRLRATLTGLVRTALTGADFPATTRLRHRALLQDSLVHLRRAIHRLSSRDAELVAEDVRLAARALERLSGRIDAEAVLDRVFASFCIGK